MGALTVAAPEQAVSLWTRDFWLFFVARAVARMGDMMLPVALTAGLVSFGHGVGAVGAAMASFSATFAAFVIFGGVLADRFDTRKLMVWADIVRIGTQGLVAVMFFSGHVILWQICVLAVVNGLCAALFQPGVASTIPRIARDVQGANGAIRTAESVMSIAGPAVAGLLIGATSVGGVFVAHAATYLISATCLLALRLPEATVEVVRSSFRIDLREGWREFWARTWMWAVIVVWMVAQVTAFGPTAPLVATEIVIEHGEGAFGLVSAVGGLGMAIGGLLAMRFRPIRPLRAGGLALFGFCVQPVSVGLDLPVPVLAVAFAVAGGAGAFWGVMWATSVQTQVPPGVLNRIHAYEVAGSLAMMPVGQALAGPAAALLGPSAVLLTSGVMAVLCCVALVSVPAIRNLNRV